MTRPRGIEIDPYRASFDRKMLRNAKALGTACAKALNRIVADRIKLATPEELNQRATREPLWPYQYKGSLADWQRWCAERGDAQTLKEVEAAFAALTFGPLAQLECKIGGTETEPVRFFGGDGADLGTAVAQAIEQVRGGEPLDYGDEWPDYYGQDDDET